MEHNNSRERSNGILLLLLVFMMESRSMFARACNDTTASLPIVGEIGYIIDSNA